MDSVSARLPLLSHLPLRGRARQPVQVPDGAYPTCFAKRTVSMNVIRTGERWSWRLRDDAGVTARQHGLWTNCRPLRLDPVRRGGRDYDNERSDLARFVLTEDRPERIRRTAHGASEGSQVHDFPPPTGYVDRALQGEVRSGPHPRHTVEMESRIPFFRPADRTLDPSKVPRRTRPAPVRAGGGRRRQSEKGNRQPARGRAVEARFYDRRGGPDYGTWPIGDGPGGREVGAIEGGRVPPLNRSLDNAIANGGPVFLPARYAGADATPVGNERAGS